MRSARYNQAMLSRKIQWTGYEHCTRSESRKEGRETAPKGVEKEKEQRLRACKERRNSRATW